jgi:hypothetical protein
MIKKKYMEMIPDAAETVLGYFGFYRNVYGDRKNTGTREWGLQELKKEKETMEKRK